MTLRRFACTLSASLLLAACGGDLGDTGGGSGGGNGNLRLVNASQTAFLDLYEGNTALASNVALYGASSYTSVSRGTRSLTVRAPGNNTALASANATVVRDDHQAVVAYTAAGAAAGTVTTTFLPDDEALPTTNNAKLRIFNTAAPALDVFVTTTTCAALAGSAVAPTAGSVVGLQNGYALLSASTTAYRVCVTGAGVRSDVRLDLPAFVLSNQRIVTLILVVEPSGALQGVALDQQGAAALVQKT